MEIELDPGALALAVRYTPFALLLSHFPTNYHCLVSFCHQKQTSGDDYSVNSLSNVSLLGINEMTLFFQ